MQVMVEKSGFATLESKRENNHFNSLNTNSTNQKRRASVPAAFSRS